MKIASLQDLEKIKAEAQSSLVIREGSTMESGGETCGLEKGT